MKNYILVNASGEIGENDVFEKPLEGILLNGDDKFNTAEVENLLYKAYSEDSQAFSNNGLTKLDPKDVIKALSNDGSVEAEVATESAEETGYYKPGGTPGEAIPGTSSENKNR
jgi:hypothetical protein